MFGEVLNRASCPTRATAAHRHPITCNSTPKYGRQPRRVVTRSPQVQNAIRYFMRRKRLTVIKGWRRVLSVADGQKQKKAA